MRQKTKLFKPVWKHWRNAFAAYRFVAISTFGAYGISTYLDSVLKPIIWKAILDTLTTKDNPLHFFWWLLLVGVLSWIANRIGDWCIVRSEAGFIKYLKDYALKQLVLYPTDFFLSVFTGEIIAKVRRFSEMSENVFDEVVFNLFRIAVILIGIMIAVWHTLPITGAILTVWVIVFGFMSWYLTNTRTPLDLAAADADSATTGHISDTVSSIHMIHSYTAEQREYVSLKKSTAREYQKRFAAWFKENIHSAVLTVLTLALEIIVMYITVQKALAGEATVGTVLLVQSFIATVTMYMWNLGKSVSRIRRSLADAYDMSAILTEHEAEAKEAQPITVPVSNQNQLDVTFENVSFSYPSHNRPVLRNCSFHLEPRKRYGLVGATGSGKTTLSRLLLRQYDLAPKNGKILIGGEDITNTDPRLVRSLISYVQQDQQFPFRTVREIIAFGKPDATEEEIVEAAKKASCHTFITELLEHGYDTKVGERGIKLSGGQRQRLAIAAAFLKDAPIFLFDEPTSALDAETESLIQAVLENMLDKTMLVIAHRLSTVAALDEILVLHHGKLHERGTHDELMNVENGLYRHYWFKQFTQQKIMT